MSLTCFHTLSDAVLHRDPLNPVAFCEGCAAVPDGVVKQAHEFDAMSPDERLRCAVAAVTAKLNHDRMHDLRAHEERNGRPKRAPWR